MSEDVTNAIGPDRRTFVKRLVLGTAFAAPAVATFKMSGIAAVFGDAPASVSGAPNTTTTPPPPPSGKFPTSVGCITLQANTQSFNLTDGVTGFGINVAIPIGALALGTILCVYRGDLSAIDADVPADETPSSAYAVVWHSPPSNLSPDATTSLTMTVTDTSIPAGAPVYMYDKTTGDIENVGTTTDGQWQVTFKEDPGFAATNPPAAAPPTDSTPAAPIVAPAHTTG